MQAPTTTRRPDWQPGHIPRLSYRNAVADEDSDADNDDGSNTTASPKASGPTIRQIRQSMNLPPSPPAGTASSTSTAPPKKKPSLFGGLFAVKEPTQVALNQVAAQMIALHGSTSATKVPNVRLEKMPQHVPKVNSKWDGVPEAIKVREKHEKERQRAAKRQSVNYSAVRPRSADSSERRGRPRLSRNSSSTNDSYLNATKSSVSQDSDAHTPNPHRFYAMSVNSSGDLASQQRHEDRPQPASERSQSLKSASRNSLPETTAYFLRTAPALPAVPAKRRLGPGTHEPVSTYKDRSPPPPLPKTEPAPTIDVVSEHTSSTATTPHEDWPLTPSTRQIPESEAEMKHSVLVAVPEEPSLTSSGVDVLAPPVPAKKKVVPDSGTAFLAGEARPFELPDEDEIAVTTEDLPLRQWGSGTGPGNPMTASAIERVQQDLEKRPDSSRARLGLRASMVLRTDAAPWHGGDSLSDSSLSPRSATTRSSGQLSPRYSLPKTLSRFGKDKS